MEIEVEIIRKDGSDREKMSDVDRRWCCFKETKKIINNNQYIVQNAIDLQV